ncbi:MAG: hypothetical protein ACJAZN_002815 [Planctomycetota bacterium]|jgi:hypothetical protein
MNTEPYPTSDLTAHEGGAPGRPPKRGLVARASGLLGGLALLSSSAVPAAIAVPAPTAGNTVSSAVSTAPQRDSDTRNTSLGIRITEEQEEATEKGLRWLADHQSEDGSWTAGVGYKLNDRYRTTREGDGHVGVTSLAGIAFLGGGHLPGRGKHGRTLDKCIDYVLSCVNDDGYISRGGTRMYSHAFSTLFLAEVFGMSHREDVRIRLQKAIDFIVKSQNDEGGWRYEPLARDSDMSIVVCQVLALRAARNIGIRVPKSTIDQAIRYVVDSAVTGSGGRMDRFIGVGTFSYQRQARSRTTFPLTAAGVTALNGLGIYSDELIDRGVDFLNAEMDRFNHRYGMNGHYFFWYGHYYGVQAMYTKGGNDWKNYFTRMRSFLLKRQRPDGSWMNSVGPGEAFSTAMACLILEIPYDFLPIFHR